MPHLLANAIPLAYQLDGPADAPPLVLINSLGTDRRMWDAQVKLFGQRLRVVRYDVRGHGQSGLAAEPYSLEQLGGDLLVLLDHLGIEQAHLCGLSLGGLIAQWFAIHHPQRVSSAVFANTAARIGSEAMWDARIAAVQAGGMAAVRDAVVARFLHQDFRAQHPAETERISAMLEATSPAGYAAACAALRNADLRAAVSAVSLPSLIIVGELDEATPPAQAEALHAAIQGSQLLILPRASHLSNIEQPEAFNGAVLRFLGQASTR